MYMMYICRCTGCFSTSALLIRCSLNFNDRLLAYIVLCNRRGSQRCILYVNLTISTAAVLQIVEIVSRGNWKYSYFLILFWFFLTHLMWLRAIHKNDHQEALMHKETMLALRVCSDLIFDVEKLHKRLKSLFLPYTNCTTQRISVYYEIVKVIGSLNLQTTSN